MDACNSDTHPVTDSPHNQPCVCDMAFAMMLYSILVLLLICVIADGMGAAPHWFDKYVCAVFFVWVTL